MTAISQSDDLAIGEVIAAEEARCRAVDASDRAALSVILGDDFTNQHSSGTTENKEEKLDRCSSASHTTYTRGDDLFVRIYGDTAVMTGDMDTHFPSKDGEPGRVLGQVAIQVWVRRDVRWQLVAMQTANRATD
jgi:hypothetical protein